MAQIRGSVGGTVASRNLGGAYMKARVAPVNRKTPAQTLARANFAANSKLWSGVMTAAQRAAWSFFAQANPLVNVLGASIIVSGLAMAQKLNQRLLQIGEPYILDPPADLSVPATPLPTGMVLTSAVPDVYFDTAVQTTLGTVEYYVFMSRQLAAGKTAAATDMRFIGTVGPEDGTGDITVTSKYIAMFGTPIPGQSVGGVVSTINVASGAVTPGLRFNAIVGA
jgi:hypothetical protein